MPIGRISFNLQSSLFIKELEARRRSFGPGQTVAYKLVVPEDLKWWYWLEFGTAGRQDADAPFRTAHSGTYPIDPVNAKSLAFPDSSGKIRFTFHVDHPGIRPRLIYRGVRDDILTFAKIAMRTSLTEGVRIASLRTALRDGIMPYAKARMAERLESEAPGVKTSLNNPFK